VEGLRGGWGHLVIGCRGEGGLGPPEQVTLKPRDGGEQTVWRERPGGAIQACGRTGVQGATTKAMGWPLVT
jgi:hypothetical protein